MWISNQSFDISPVDIRVEIDGEPILKKSFKVENQHHFEEFCLKLTPGRHVIELWSVKGEAHLKQDFNVKSNHWGTVLYWYYADPMYRPYPEGKKHFQFEQLDYRPEIY